MKIAVKPGLEIGEGCKPFIIAEIGSNWRTLDDCLLSISHAKLCGADAVKFQLFGPRDLHGIIGSGLVGAMPYLDPAWLPKLKAKADACGIEFMCSAFSPKLVEAVDPYVNIHKVASAEMTHVRILEKLKEIGRPVILSTGASGLADIQEALRILDFTPVILMYCVAAYPARSVNLSHIPLMAATFGRLVGYSDHTVDAVTIPYQAMKAGACVLENHVSFIETETPDSKHSITCDEFKNMVTVLRTGQETVHHAQERPMILRHNRRLIAIQDIEPGTALVEGSNFGIYRSLKDDTHALSPFAISAVAGKPALRAIKAGDGIGPGDV